MAAPLGEPSTRANPCCIIPYPQEPNMTQSPGDQFERLLEIMRRLREPGGCPWDREQTRTSLKPFLIEETYEVLEAIESGDTAALQEELGDLLFQVVFHAQIAVERGEFDMAALLARGVDEGRGRVSRGRRCAGRRRSRAAAGRAGRRALFARERRAPGVDRRGGSAAGCD